MGKFSTFVLTNSGIALLTKVQAGKTMTFSRCMAGDGRSSSGEDLALRKGLISEKYPMVIESIKPRPDGTVVIRTLLNNKGMTADFAFREIGIFATDPDEGNILFAIANAGEAADIIPAYGGSEVVDQVIDLVTVIGKTANVTAKVDEDAVFVSQVEFAEHKADPAAHDVATQQKAGFMSGADKGNLNAAYAHISVAAPHSGHAPIAHVGAGGSTHPVATTTVAGFMSGTDKSNLNTAYAHISVAAPHSGHAPIAHVGAGGSAHPVATTTVAGFMSDTDKSNLNTAYAHISVAAPHSGHAPIAHVGAGGNAHLIATQTTAGFLSSDDKRKLDSIQISAIGVLSGTIVNGGTIPLPSGFTEDQCFWTVGVTKFGYKAASSQTASIQYFQCSCDGRTVTISGQVSNVGANMAEARYIIVGVK